MKDDKVYRPRKRRRAKARAEDEEKSEVGGDAEEVGLKFDKASLLLKYLRNKFKLSSASRDVTAARALLYTQVVAQMLQNKYYDPKTKKKRKVELSLECLSAENGADKRSGKKRFRFSMLSLILEYPDKDSAVHAFVIFNKILLSKCVDGVDLKLLCENGSEKSFFKLILQYCIAVDWYPKQISEILNPLIAKKDDQELQRLSKLADEIAKKDVFNDEDVTSKLVLPYESVMYKELYGRKRRGSNKSSARKRKHSEIELKATCGMEYGDVIPVLSPSVGVGAFGVNAATDALSDTVEEDCEADDGVGEPQLKYLKSEGDFEEIITPPPVYEMLLGDEQQEFKEFNFSGPQDYYAAAEAALAGETVDQNRLLLPYGGQTSLENIQQDNLSYTSLNNDHSVIENARKVKFCNQCNAFNFIACSHSVSNAR